METIRGELAENLASITGWQVSAYMLANPTPPCGYVVPGEVTYDEAMGRGHDLLTMRVVVLAGATSDIGGQRKLDEFLAPDGASSVKAALEASRTLDGTVSDLRVVSATGYRSYSLAGGGVAVGCEWTVQIIT